MQHFDDFAQMQRDAERRVMEMQKRAMAAIENTDVLPQRPNKPTTLPNKNPPEPRYETPNKHIIPGLNLSGEDSEKALLIMILFLLLREEADERLILTLLYILM